MASANKFVDDMTRVVSGAAGVAQGAVKEAESTMKGWTRKWVNDQGFVSREEFQAVSDMAKKARQENDDLREELKTLSARVEALEGKKAKSNTKK